MVPNARESKQTTRRQLLRLMGVAGAASLVAACAPAAPAPPTAAPAPAAAPPAAPPTTAPAAAAPPAATAAAPAAKAEPAPTTAPAAKPAGGFPTKPIEIIVSFNPGGGFDATARQLAVPLQQELGQPVVVKNIAGGAQRIAAREFQRAAPDGHILGYLADPELFASTLVDPAEGFDIKSWIWVSGIETRDALVYVAKGSPFKTVEELITAGRDGQRLRFGHNGIGGYLPMQVVFASVTGIKNAAMVGGYTGTGDLIPALIRGDVDVMVLSELSSALKFVQSGDLRPLVTLGEKRVPSLSDVRTAREANLPDLPALNALSASYGIVVPPATPADRVKVLQAAVQKALKSPSFLDWAEKSGKKDQLTPWTAEEMAERKKKEYANYGNNAEAIKKYATS